jgi:hypothetical protein
MQLNHEEGAKKKKKERGKKVRMGHGKSRLDYHTWSMSASAVASQVSISEASD